MITVKEILEVVNYNITNLDPYLWDCYGNGVVTISSSDDCLMSKFSVDIIYQPVSGEVFELSVHDFLRNRAYRIINPDYRQYYLDECEDRGIDPQEAWDDVDYVDLDLNSDFLEKTYAIINGEDYDDRVTLELTMSDEDLLKYMKVAHEMNITFNDLINLALTEALEANKKDLSFP